MINSDLNLQHSFALLWMGRRGHKRRYGGAMWAKVFVRFRNIFTVLFNVK